MASGHRWITCLVTIGVVICVGEASMGAAKKQTPSLKTQITTPVPDLHLDWAISATSPTATDKDAWRDAEQQRPRVEALKDPFTKLGNQSCPERSSLTPPERVVWEDEKETKGVNL